METKKIAVIALAFLVGFGAGWFGFDSYGTKAPKKVNLKLPPEPAASDVSNCVLSHGVHYSTAEAIPSMDKGIAGPTYMYAQNTGEVVGIEYHVTEQALKDWENPQLYNIEREPSWQFPIPFDLKGANYDHMLLSWVGGHPGLLKPHIDIHLFTITAEERARLCDGQADQKPNPAAQNHAQ